MTSFRFFVVLIGLVLCSQLQAAEHAGRVGVHKIEDVLIYEDTKFYSSFPSIVRRPDGELLVAFRRAPDRRAFGESGITHTDPNSHLVLVRSRDGGRTWNREPQLMFAHPFGGSQDPCMVQLRDGTILCSSYGWAQMPPNAFAKMKQPVARAGDFAFLGGVLLCSRKRGGDWEGADVSPPPRGPGPLHLFGHKIPL